MPGSNNIKIGSPKDLCILAFDSEYVPGQKTNRLLSYQLFGICGGREWPLFLVQHGERLTLAEIIGRALEAGKEAGAYAHYPEEVYLCAHFSIADLTMLKNYPELKTQFDSLRKTHVSVRAPVSVTWTDRNRHQRNVEVILRDTMLLTPQGRSLAALGELHGHPKLELPPGAIERMDKLLDENPDLFRSYAMRDAQIAARHGVYMSRLNQEWTGDCAIPITLGGLAMKYSQGYWEAKGVGWRAALGFETVQKKIWTKTGYRTIECDVPLPGFLENAALATEAYFGGRNETFLYGATGVGEFKDMDLAGAYTTALAMVGTPQYDRPIHTNRLEDFGAETMGFARVQFKFPDTVRYPNLPIRTDYGLVFVLEGETYCTSQEIFVARRLGAEVSILEGAVVPTTPPYIFGDVIGEITRQRNENKGNELLNAMFKEMGNALYGKTGQALREKRVFDSRIGQSVVMPRSKFSNPFMAAFVTGFIRALLAEILNSLPANRCVVSATTDGILCDATDEEIRAASQGPLATLFAGSRMEICGNATVLEVKRRVAQVLCWRTRGQATLLLLDNGKAVLAKAGIKLPGKRKNAAEENQEMIELFLNRTPETALEIEIFRNLREIWHEGGDLCKTPVTRRVRMDFDWKRQAAHSSTVEIRAASYLTFTTRPWQTVDEFIRCREQWEIFYRESGRCLHTQEDLQAFTEYLQMTDVNALGVNRSILRGPVKLATRLVCRAFVRSAWGLSKKGITNGEFVAFMAEGG